ncbi:mitochondrial branched-chain alpha-ketoacid dehydrogenase kinase-domain-containing protein [Endogone sp. FLAS-F59071]|nr:mitochondrial branched-chain alpha-ketoacid dehydrogenase kinase-domain-containing protein [Endogone sp. FLAS-F59071]|eukprot:RUS21955.1 mitochondrial branched-chain alpha-ketoacid dehydrogenase kinase-domain-containing protein [Endogone sp. FLAS-F59071]
MVVSTQALNAIPKDIMTKLWTAKATRVSLKQIYSIGRHVQESNNKAALVIPAQFLADELPIRYTNVIQMLNSGQELPHQALSHTPTFRKVTQRYLEDIHALTRFPKPDTATREEQFTDLLRSLQRRHRNNISSLGESFKELYAINKVTPGDLDEMKTQRFFDKVYGFSLGTNLLIGEHIALHDEGRNLVQKISPITVAEKAVADARRVCESHYARESPAVKIIACDPTVTTTYVAEHLHRVLFEVLKNSLRATMEFHPQSPAPPLKVIVVKGDEDVTIKISDQGGGIPESKTKRIWSYVTGKSIQDMEDSTNVIKTEPKVSEDMKDYLELPLCGFGHGLPVARLTARYFGGELSLVSMEGFGTDAYLALYRDDTCPENYPELLPETELTLDGLAAASSAPLRSAPDLDISFEGQVDSLGHSAGAGVLAS